MKSDGKVVSINQAPSSGMGARLPVPLQSLRDTSLAHLRSALRRLFDSVDDTLFAMADRATSNGEQNLLFEAMRGVRLKRKQVERAFLQGVIVAFAQLLQPGAARSKASIETLTAEKLSLVQNDELEQNVAIDAMVGKVRGRCNVPLELLRRRLEQIAAQTVETHANPLSAARLCEIFVEACRDLNVDIQIKLILYKLFERQVLDGIDGLYEDANAQLIAAGVLPELRHVHSPREARRASAPASTASGVSTTDLGDLQALLAQARAAVSAPSMPAPDVLPVSGQDVLRLLSHLQQHLPAEAQERDPRWELQALLGRASERAGRPRVLGELEGNVIDLVSMLFEFILDDRNLPDSLKALLGRLQIPMIKVALLDRDFFARSGHPARRLLNEIAMASVGWGDHDEFRRGSLYQKIEQIVQRLLGEFNDDPALFEELLEDFLAFTGEERRRSELLEQRTRDAEVGRAKAEQAGRCVEAAINERMQGRHLPQVVVNIVEEAWSQVLLLTLLKHGEASAEWTHVLSTLDELLWSVMPQESPEARQALLLRVPPLLANLREGLASAAFDPFSTSDFFARLEALHFRALRGGQDTQAPGVQARTDVSSDPALAEVVVDKPASPAPVAAPTDEPLADDASRQVDALRVGAWLELPREGPRQRCKLAAIIRPEGRYVFVNRTGMKVLEQNRDTLAAAFRAGQVRVLDDAQLFDRALESVIGNLRQARSRTPGKDE